MMPNQPAPYNLRNWKTVALRYDSFVYDATKTGQYLPLVTLQTNGVNYPQNPAFGLHTYVGTNSPNGNEAINVLPSLVGASLCGIDKRSQFGRNWIVMAQDFFNKNNGQNIYLNNKGGGSGSDWWYDLMPNVYFYQLHHLYPTAPGSEAEWQFETIAERFLASVKALGGRETPWQKGNFDYRAFNFQTMQPNPNGVHEPEAAGAYAWVLYAAYLKTGNESYRKAAEWSLEFLNDWATNPSYELQLPYGTLTAARMNAELGTRYHVEKMINWSFDRGPLRGWGTIVGKWGGFDCSGLVGEANDAGNDYAFQLNGVQQAAALAPLVRYDKRFARAVGKWMLNLTNATRLFFPAFLPSNYQDATTWSNTHDPERVIGYEALRQQWQGISPFSTGDALGGGWAATNLSLYSTGSIGYLGSIIEPTTVSRILKIDVLKTDFFHRAAYPTFLFYNSYTSAQTIAFDAGSGTSDIYDAISESFLLKNATGTVNLTIPANSVILVSICPANGAISYDRNKMLIDGVVVDYSQTAVAWQRPPRIQSAIAADTVVETGTVTSLFSKVQSGDSPDLNYTWSATDGVLNVNGGTGQWTAPSGTTGSVTFQLIVTDGNGLADTATFELAVVSEINKAPLVTINKTESYTVPSGKLSIQAAASDPNNDPLTYEWTFSAGAFSGTGSQVEWTAPTAPGIYEIKVQVSDDEGLSTEAISRVLVRNFTSVQGNMVAYYNFSGQTNDQTVNQLNGIPFATAFVPDIFSIQNQALKFNGVNSRVTINNQAVLNFQDGITVSAWFKAEELPAKETFLVSHGSWQNRWKLSFTPEKNLRWTVNTLSAVGDLDTELPVTTDSFYHLTATYDGELMAIYLNGRLNNYKYLSGKIRTTSIALLLGQILPGNTEYNYKGVLDEVKIFNHALTPVETAVLYADETTSTGSPLEPAQLFLKVTPNPAQNWADISIEGGLQAEETISAVEAYDITGRLVVRKSDVLMGSKFRLDISNWKPGAYWIIIRSEKGIGKTLLVK